MVKVHTIPKNFQMVPGQELNLNLSKPFSIYVPAERPQGLPGLKARKVALGQERLLLDGYGQTGAEGESFGTSVSGCSLPSG